MTKFVPCDKKWDKNVTKCQNMHFMHKKCIKNPKNVTKIGQNFLRCDKLGTKFVITK